MPLAPDIIARPGPLAIPFTYELGSTEQLRAVSAFAHWDGTNASGAFLPCLTFYDQNGNRFMRVFPSQTIPVGGTADVTYAPFPGGIGPYSGVSVGQWYYATPVAPATAPAGAVAGVAFQNGWANVQQLDGGYTPLLYRIEQGGATARVVGAIGGGTFGAPALALPAAVTPTYDISKLVAGVNTTSGLVCNLSSDGLLVPVGVFGFGLTPLYSITLNASAATIDTGANGIPSGHGDLIVYIYCRTDRAALQDNIALTLNGDSGANYDAQRLQGSATTVATVNQNASTSLTAGMNCASATATAGVYAFIKVLIPAYDTTAGFKVAEVISSSPLENSNASIQVWGAMWRNSAAINQITLKSTTGSNFVAGTRVVVYGAN